MKHLLILTLLLISILGQSKAQQKELLINNDFSSGQEGWWINGANVLSDNGILTFNISNPGLNIWDIQLGQGRFTLRKGYRYTLLWKLKRESGPMAVILSLGHDPYTSFIYKSLTGSGNNWLESSASYDHISSDISDIIVSVQLGGNASSAFFDYISLKEEPIPEKKVNLTFQVDMKNESVSPNGVFVSGSFNNWDSPVKMIQTENIYSTTLNLPSGKVFEYKFINGNNYENITGDCTTGEFGNRLVTVPQVENALPPVCFNSCSLCVDPLVLNENPGPGVVSYYGQMQAIGNRIYGSRTNTQVQVKGVSFYWSLWNGEVFYNAGAVNALVDDWKAEIIRIPMAVEANENWPGGDYGYLDPKGSSRQLSLVEKLVDAAIFRNIYVIIDYHSHEAHLHTANSKEFFGYMAKKYGKYDNVIFEVYNEPITPNWPVIKAYVEDVIDTIRVYSDNLVIVGTEVYSQRVDNASLSPVNDSNVAYVFHFYASHGDDVRNYISKALNNNVTLFASEWGNIYVAGEKEGTVDDDAFKNSDTWHSLLDANMISSTAWSVYSNDLATPSEYSLFKNTSSIATRNGDGWANTSNMTRSGLYIYNLLKDHSKSATWRYATKTSLVNLTFNVDMKNEPVSPNGVFLSCSSNGWVKSPMTNISGSVWSATIQLAAGDYVKYNFINGNSPETGESASCFDWNKHRSLYVPDDNSALDIVCFNSCSECPQPVTYTVSASPNPSYGGTVTGSGTFYENSVAKLTASPSLGYEFVNWTINGNVVSSNYSYSFTVTGNISLQANFRLIPPKTYTVTTVIIPTNSGIATGTGTYEENETANLTASPAQGYEFVNWTINGNVVSSNASYSLTVTGNITIEANFRLIPPKTYTVTVITVPENGGTVLGAGTYNEGQSVVLTASPDSDFNFTGWSSNGSDISDDLSYSFILTENTTLLANFTPKTNFKNLIYSSGNLNIFPNPSEGMIYLSGIPFSSNYLIRLYDNNGRIVFKQNIEDQYLSSLNLSSLKSGIYFLIITGESFTLSNKISIK
jgi:hypothetical protein